ncbi:uncharacterized protein ColSpa_06868 [Colletotrichum spaethianum]|uniref:Uncharacterized protein n=1 Tax=Colletotrichum spaethianum TaxID=700344 RepID=A0AA37NYX2_9PEZI|nr:uncharacterized protein ColSpa_06868 [Colletotrichum spaethianum]GKT46687.1 hypothetical protein ColSpa_06868 [Colletotrichum spaethianum]
MVSAFPVNRQTFVGLIAFLFFLWTLSTFTHSTSTTPTHVTGNQQSQPDRKPADTPDYSSTDKSRPGADISRPEQPPQYSLPPWYENDKEKAASEASKTSPNVAQHSTSAGTTKAGSKSEHAAASTKPESSSLSKAHDRPLILYAFAESDAARENLKFFVNQGLHDAADFIFILNGETNVTDTIPEKSNIKVISRPNTCFDLGAYGEVLRKDDLYKKYKRFITMNASIRGPFLPHWAQSCWSDLYLGRLTNEVKSMIWATDETGIDLLLNPPPGSSVKDQFGTENDPVGLGGCYDGWNQAVHAEIGATSTFLKQGYKVDLMMTAFHKSKKYIEECDSSQNGDVLWNGKYFGTNVHPYETIFIKANRDIDPTLIEHLTAWQQASGYDSYSACKASS